MVNLLPFALLTLWVSMSKTEHDKRLLAGAFQATKVNTWKDLIITPSGLLQKLHSHHLLYKRTRIKVMEIIAVFQLTFVFLFSGL